MTCGFSEKELKILYKITFKRRWCPKKHISIDDLVSGNPKHLIGDYHKAVDNLIRNKWLRSYKSQNRIDVCIEKDRMHELLDIFNYHSQEYSFLKNLEFIK